MSRPAKLARRIGNSLTLRIELLYFEGCPGVAETLCAIERVVAEGELEADVAMVDVGSGNHPGFSGSPTVLVDGEDPFPASRTVGLSCRLYETPEGPRNSLTANMLRSAIGKNT